MTKMHYPSKKTIQVVIADDNPKALNGLCAILTTQAGIAIAGKASQGAEALALIEALTPQVALLDVRMPVMDGLEAARRIKKQWPQVRVVLISMSTDPQKEALEAGADTFLVKGCPTEELISAILGAEPGKNDGRENKNQPDP